MMHQICFVFVFFNFPRSLGFFFKRFTRHWASKQNQNLKNGKRNISRSAFVRYFIPPSNSFFFFSFAAVCYFWRWPRRFPLPTSFCDTIAIFIILPLDLWPWCSEKNCWLKSIKKLNRCERRRVRWKEKSFSFFGGTKFEMWTLGGSSYLR